MAAATTRRRRGTRKSPKSKTPSIRRETFLSFDLTPPKPLTLLFSILIFIFAELVHWTNLGSPTFQSGFILALVAYLVLLCGVVFRGV
jgi:hypothetical protein